MASMNVESPINGTDYPNGHNRPSPTTTTDGRSKAIKWSLLLLNIFFTAVGTIGGPLLLRLYFIHGGGRRWLSSCLQNAGFPILFIPLLILYARARAQGVPPSKFFIEPKLFFASAVIGVLLGFDNFMYALGLSYIPVSTSALLFATQLAFTAIFALLIVKHKFTPYSINSVILMTLGSIMLGLHTNGDRPAGTSKAKYLLGFFCTLGSAALAGFIWPSIEYCYSKASRRVNFTTVLQFQLGVAVFATIFSITGMLVNNDFKVIPREAREYKLGNGMYYFVLVATAVAFQLAFIGSLGVIFCTTSLFSGVVSAVLLPLTQIAAVIAYKEKFTGEKGMALALSLWGFVSYFYGEYRSTKNNDVKRLAQAQTQAQDQAQAHPSPV
ncbi:purine permease 3-like [Magnolia sinica]|uniref:purine permease 3-like n=1 Tax=Magnolia sinica TaxID=86752 RepID=UPI002658D7B4|nr:purine permease 3-like [Magnolia sinica]